MGVAGGMVFLFFLSKSLDFRQKRVQAPIIAARQAEAARRAAELAAEDVDPLPTYNPDLPEEVRIEMEDLEARGIGEVGPIQQEWQQQQLERTITQLRIISTLPPPPEYTPDETAQGEEREIDGVVVATPATPVTPLPQETTEEQEAEGEGLRGDREGATDLRSDVLASASPIDPQDPPIPRYSSEVSRPVIPPATDPEQQLPQPQP